MFLSHRWQLFSHLSKKAVGATERIQEIFYLDAEAVELEAPKPATIIMPIKYFSWSKGKSQEMAHIKNFLHNTIFIKNLHMDKDYREIETPMSSVFRLRS